MTSTTTTCERQVCALTEDDQREMRPCVRNTGHEGVCRHKVADLPNDGPKVVHIADVGAIDAARELGVQYRTWCGVWRWPSGNTYRFARLSESHPRSCPLCILTKESER